MKVAVLGASAKPERYSNKAVQQLQEGGHTVFPVHPALAEIHGLPVYSRLSAIPEALDVVTVYLSARHSDPLAAEIVDACPKQVIFNPGAENDALAATLSEHGIETLEACTLVLLSTGQFGQGLRELA